MVKSEPEIRRAKAKLYVAKCNSEVHEAPWTAGRSNNRSGGGIYTALEMAELAYKVHGLPYEAGLSKMSDYDPRRFVWVYDESGDADDCVKIFDAKTRKLAVWRGFAG